MTSASVLASRLSATDWQPVRSELLKQGQSAQGPFSQQAYVKASNTGVFDRFGKSVAISGDTLVVGANQERSNATGVNGDQANNATNNAGAAYVFVRTAEGWSQQAYLKASNTGAGDYFGWSVAISGDTIVVGAEGEDSNATGVNGDEVNNLADASGAAYVFVRSEGNWSQQAYLKASNTDNKDTAPDSGDRFGTSVAISGDTIVVGASGEWSNAVGINGDESDNSARDAGAAYVFVRNAGNWSQQAYIKAGNTDAGDYFGGQVAISGNTLVVGARREDSNAVGVDGDKADNSALDSGAAYVFVRNAGTWIQQAYLKASNTDGNDWFGSSVAIADDTVVLSAPYEDSNAIGVNGNEADNSIRDAGAVYVFTRDSDSWSQQAYLKASNSRNEDEFGYSVNVSGDSIIVGAPYENSNATGVNGVGTANDKTNSGAAYLFARNNGNWRQQIYMKASNSRANHLFGQSVAVLDNTSVASAIWEDSNATGIDGNQANSSAPQSGAAYVFVDDQIFSHGFDS